MKDFDCIDSISPFIGVIVDRLCREVGDAAVTEVFTMYTDIVRKLYQRNGEIGSSEDTEADLTRHIRNSKKRSVEIFSKYQTFEMKTLKWHMFSNIGTDIKRMVEYSS